MAPEHKRVRILSDWSQMPIWVDLTSKEVIIDWHGSNTTAFYIKHNADTEEYELEEVGGLENVRAIESRYTLSDEIEEGLGDKINDAVQELAKWWVRAPVPVSCHHCGDFITNLFEHADELAGNEEVGLWEQSDAGLDSTFAVCVDCAAFGGKRHNPTVKVTHIYEPEIWESIKAHEGEKLAKLGKLEEDQDGGASFILEFEGLNQINTERLRLLLQLAAGLDAPIGEPTIFFEVKQE